MRGSKRLSLKFKDRDAFGRFCLALTNDDVPFTHTGFLTIVIAKELFERLTGEPHTLVEKFKAAGLLETSPAASTGRRALISSERAKELLRKYSKSL